MKSMGMRKPARKKVESPFAKNLKSLMTDRELTIKAVAEISGVSTSVVGDWLSGSVPHDLTRVSKLASTLQCDFQWLLTGERTPTKSKELVLADVFDIESDPAFTGIFMIEAKRLKKKS